MCAVECPSNVNIPKLMLEAKSRYREAHRASPVEMILGRAETVSRLGHLAAPLANRLINQPRPPAPGRAAPGHRPAPPDGALRPPDLPPAGSGRRRGSWPHVARPAATRRGRRRPPRLPSPTSTTSSPTTTTRSWPSPWSRVLAAHGVRVVLPEQRASGIPEMLYGYADKAPGDRRSST